MTGMDRGSQRRADDIQTKIDDLVKATRGTKHLRAVQDLRDKFDNLRQVLSNDDNVYISLYISISVLICMSKTIIENDIFFLGGR